MYPILLLRVYDFRQWLALRHNGRRTKSVVSFYYSISVHWLFFFAKRNVVHIPKRYTSLILLWNCSTIALFFWNKEPDRYFKKKVASFYYRISVKWLIFWNNEPDHYSKKTIVSFYYTISVYKLPFSE
jgi:hypothetical protein